VTVHLSERELAKIAWRGGLENSKLMECTLMLLPSCQCCAADGNLRACAESSVSSINTMEEQPPRNVPLVAAVAASGRHGFRKGVCRTITLVQGFGVEGDAHGGATVQHLYDKAKEPYRPNLRQVHLMEEELILELNALGFCVAAGDLGENITTRHIRLAGLDSGAVLELGSDARIQITGLRSPCVKIERYKPGLRRAVTRTSTGPAAVKRAVMAVVVASGTVAAGDAIRIVEQMRGVRKGLCPV
jgi:MOSC domain-containing protein YiiM